MKKLICGLLSILLLLQTQLVFPSESIPYEWGQVPVGAHGFVTGIVFHPSEKDLVYIRTDVGGAYRWDAKNKSWIQLCDGFGIEDRFLYGIDGIAIDPQNPDVVYIAAGEYTWSDGDVLKSTDRGETWVRTGLNKKFSANGNMRSMGECIAVDPNNSSIVYCGTAKDGLWRSKDGALTWEKVQGVEAKSDETNKVRNIVFNGNAAKDGISKTIYVGIYNKGIYQSINGGEDWLLMQGAPIKPKRMEVGKSGALYVAASNGLWKFSEKRWTEISAPDQIGKSHNAVSIDPTNENIIMCVGYSSNLMHLPFYRTTNGGRTWVNKWDKAKFTTTLPWSQQKDNDFSSNTSDIKIDPFNTQRVMFSDFFGVFTTEDINAEATQWTNPIKGIEEVVPRDAISPPTGKYRLLTAIADVDGFPYEDTSKYPSRYIRLDRQETDEPWMMGSTQIDYCIEDPKLVLRIGVDWNSQGKIEISKDNTESWENITTIPHYVDKDGKDIGAIPYGRGAMSATKNPETTNPAIVLIPAYNVNANRMLPEGMNTVPIVSLDMGKTWQQSKGFPEGTNIMDDYWDKHTPITSDKVNGSKFYVSTKNYVYYSEDFGLNWTQGARIEGNDNQTMIRSTPGVEGDVWVSMGGSGMYHSTDGGKVFEKLPNITDCVTFGFGKEAPDSKYPTLYLYGNVGDSQGMFISTDMGKSFQKINDEQYKLGASPNIVVGDSRTFGVVYVGTDGRGLFVGKHKGTVLSTGASIIVTENDKLQINYNKNAIQLVNKIAIKNGNIMVPVREFVKYFGGNVQWDSQTESIIAKRNELAVGLFTGMAYGQKDEVSIAFKLGGREASVGNRNITLSEVPYLINDTMYVPIDAIIDAFGAESAFDATKKIFSITDNALIMY